jgi:iron(III) transport system ATP-binding protein
MGRVAIEGVAKAFGPKAVLRDLSLAIEDGECFTLLGPSGCGKTVLLRLVAGFETLDAGEIRIGGRLVSGRGVNVPPEERNLGVVVQDYAVWPHLTVRDNTRYPLKFRQLEGKEERVQTMLDQVGLGALGERYPSQLSGGQQQRVAVARAVGGRPSILLADEPTGNLDSTNGDAVMDLLKELHRRGSTICMVTHDQRFAQHADRTIHLFDGRVVEESFAKA